MTDELQRAMAEYEEARARYRKAVLASLDGASNGDVIRQSIRDFQRASARLKLLAPAQRGLPPPPPPQPAPAEEAVEAVTGAWSAVRRAVSGVGARLRTSVLSSG